MVNNNKDLTAAKVIGENENVVRIMSIHKSKGLEFPVVFLSCTSKKFNFMDLKDNILLHQKLGIGPQYIDYKKKIKYSTLAKEAIKEFGFNEINPITLNTAKGKITRISQVAIKATIQIKKIRTFVFPCNLSRKVLPGIKLINNLSSITITPLFQTQ